MYVSMCVSVCVCVCVCVYVCIYVCKEYDVKSVGFNMHIQIAWKPEIGFIVHLQSKLL